MPPRTLFTHELIEQNRKRRQIIGRLELARKTLSAPGGQKVQRVITNTTRQVQALMRPNQATLGAFGGLSAQTVDQTFQVKALTAGDGEPLRTAYHLLSVDDLGLWRGPEYGLVKQCREAARGACIKAGIADPAATTAA